MYISPLQGYTKQFTTFLNINKEELYSQVSRLSDTRLDYQISVTHRLSYTRYSDNQIPVTQQQNSATYRLRDKREMEIGSARERDKQVDFLEV